VLTKSMQALDPEAMTRKWFSPMEMFGAGLAFDVASRCPRAARTGVPG
jgi:hypothetical protein